MTGTVKWYDSEKGFGFILTEEGNDIFVHRTGISSDSKVPQTDDKVEFDVKEGDKGPLAIDVRVL